MFIAEGNSRIMWIYYEKFLHRDIALSSTVHAAEERFVCSNEVEGCADGSIATGRIYSCEANKPDLRCRWVRVSLWFLKNQSHLVKYGNPLQNGSWSPRLGVVL